MFGNIYQLLVFLIDTAFDIFLYILVFRFLIASAGGDNHEPIVQFISRATSFITTPVRKFIPDYKGVEVGTLVIIFLVALLKSLLRIIIPFSISSFVNLFIGIVIMAFGFSLLIFGQAFFYLILFQAIISWIQPGLPLNRILTRITSPVLKPFQKLIPPISGIDFSPLVPLILIQLLNIMVVSSIISTGQAFAIG